MKKSTVILLTVILIVLGLVGLGIFGIGSSEGLANQYETETIQRGNLSRIVEAKGTIESNQSSLLFWKIPGKVANVFVEPGDQVHVGDTLATLDMASLPSYIITAQAELLNAQRALDDLLNTNLQRAQAQKVVEDAQKALEDSRHPERLQAQALLAVAQAQEAVDNAQRNYEIITTPVKQSAIDQAYANLLLAEDKVKVTEERLIFLQNYVFVSGQEALLVPDWLISSVKHDIRRAIKSVEIQLTQERLALEKSKSRYEALLEPPNPLDVASAEAELVTKKAQLAAAEKEWERVKDGFNPVEIAVLEAQLGDAQREWLRLKDGPDPDDIIRLETQISAAEATVQQVKMVAPYSGTVTRVNSKGNDLVNSGTLAFQLDDLSSLHVDLAISEIDVNRIEIGQEVLLTLDSIPARQYVGEVMDIALVGTEILGVTNFMIKAEILDPDSAIKPGMSASVEIVISEIKDVLLVPSSAIRSLNGDILVYRIGSVENVNAWSRIPLLGQNAIQTQIQPVGITLGASDNAYTEVVAGDLQVGDIVVLNPLGE
jgi:HlyD family secretion protein